MSQDDQDDLFQRWDGSAQDDLYGLDGDSPDFDAGGSGWTLDDSHLPPPPDALAAAKARMSGGAAANLDEEDADLGDFFDDLEHNDAFGATPAEDAIELPPLDASAPPSGVFEHNQAALDPEVPSFGDLQRNSDAFIASTPTSTPAEAPSPALFDAPTLDSFAGLPVTGHGADPTHDLGLDLDGDALASATPSGADAHPLDDPAARLHGPAPEGGFFEDLSGAPLFVLQNNGAILIAFATTVLMIAVTGAVGRSLLGGVVALGCYGFFYGYLTRITAASAEGAEQLPDFNDYDSVWRDGVVPTFQVITLTLVHAIPALLLALVTTHPVALGLVGFASLLTFPISFLDLSMRGSLLDMRPAWQIEAVSRAPSHYLSVAGGFAVGVGLLIVISLALAGSLDPNDLALGAVAVRFVLVVAAFAYASVLFAHVMGRFYYHDAQDLDL
jgi:hypothetical protein